MLRILYTFLLFILFPYFSQCQFFIGFEASDSTKNNEAEKAISSAPDADRNDIPFIDYRKAVIWNSPGDSVIDYAYIRKNFTDQFVSVWNHPRRLYPASRIYAINMDGKHYRAVKVSEQNFVFAEQMVDGDMDLYVYRKIPQLNGWIEFVGHDTTGKIYHNNMIIEKDKTRSKEEYFGYFYSIGNDTLKPVSVKTLKTFAENQLGETPEAKALALKFTNQTMNKSRKIAVIGLMSVGIIGLAATGGGGASLLFLAGFPVAAFVAYKNQPQTMHWGDMVEIVNTYNREIKR